MDASTDELIDRVAASLRAARHVFVLTGAGISRDSGLPTFREAQTGLWARYRAEELATPEAFAQQPDLVWRWYAWRRELVAQAEPNAGHRALVALQSHAQQCTLATQNVDGLHRRAGSQDVLELHGDITRIRCSRCSAVHDEFGPGEPPSCRACHGLLRPDVVWFGEPLPGPALERAEQAARSCDVALSVGTSGVVYPAAGLLQVAAGAGAELVYVNPQLEGRPPRAHHIAGGASEVLPRLVATAWPHTGAADTPGRP